MKKTDIREGVTYQTKTGNAARLVLEITDDWSKAKAAYPYLQEDAPAPYAIFKQMRGQHIGSISALTLNSFAAWAHSATAETEGNATDLAARISQLEADKAALMEALKQCHAELMSIHLRHGDSTHAILLSAGLSLVDALPAHLKEAAKEEAR